MRSLNKHNNEHSIFNSVQKFGKKWCPGRFSQSQWSLQPKNRKKLCYADVEFVQRGHIISMFDHSGNISKYASLVSQTQLPFHRVFSLDSLTVVYIPSTVQSIDQAP